MTLEWKSIEKDGLPKENGFYLVATGKWMGAFRFCSSISFWEGCFNVEITHYAGPFELPKEKEEIPGLTFEAAIAELSKGAKIRRKDWYPGTYLDSDHVVFSFVSDDISANDWIIVEPAPKPKMPKELQKFKDWLFKEFDK